MAANSVVALAERSLDTPDGYDGVLATPLAETDGHDVQIQLLFAAQKLIKAGYSPLEGLNAGFVKSRLKKDMDDR